MQRTLGNQAGQHLLQAIPEEIEVGYPTATTSHIGHDFSLIPLHAKTRAGIQPKLTVNIPGDVYEQEADRVAEQVLHMPDARLQRACACGGECPTCKTKQLSTGAKPAQLKRNQTGETATPAFVQDVLHSPGQPLDAGTRAYFEPRFGHDFSHVRIHTGERAAQSAKALDATAYTAGNKIVFGAGNYAPETTKGKRLLAHELTHVIQQGSAEAAASPSAGPVRHAGGLNFIQRKVESCPQWRPVDDSLVRNLIAGARREWGDDRSAWNHIYRERDSDAHCCDLSYAAAEHYLILMSGAGSCPKAEWLRLLGIAARVPLPMSPIPVFISSREIVNPFFSSDDNCRAVVPLDSDVMKWEQLAVDEICDRAESGSDAPSYYPSHWGSSAGTRLP
ncbi:MAG: DUF4157 domain-containing protein [Pyrinomonadaceae bacterium]